MAVDYEYLDYVIRNLKKENAELTARVERLERILAKNGTPEAIELRSELISEVNGYGVKGYEADHIVTDEANRPEKLFDALDDLLYCSETGGYPDDHINEQFIADARLALLAEAEKRQAAADAAQEAYEQQMDEEAMRCPRCGEKYKDTPLGVAVGGDLCPECESELAEATHLNHLPNEAW